MQDVTRKEVCRLCGGKRFEPVLPILPSPIGDAFLRPSELVHQNVYPLTTYLCLECGHLQNLDIVNPEILFRNYTYKSSASLGLVEHFRNYASAVWNMLGIAKNDLVIEIGSNDGSLLAAFKALGARVQGVDPARDIAKAATESGLPTIAEFFTSRVAADIHEQQGRAKLVCANNVFAHADNIGDIVDGIHDVLDLDGVFVFEVSYIIDMIDKFVFDTIYHEHVSHHALAPLDAFFRRHDMALFDVERVATKGGSIRGFAQRLSSGTRKTSARLDAMLAEERHRKIVEPDIYREFYRDIEARKTKVLDYVRTEKASGAVIAAYGASTTATTLFYHFELWPFVSFMVDDNPIKHGTFSPGAHIPVYASDALAEKRPGLVIILAWTYADTIIGRNQAYLKAGGRFLVPLPEIRIVERT